jgi:hypothetical protein
VTTGSIQLRRYLSARRQGRTMLTACVESGIGVEEARLWEADIASDPSILDRADPLPNSAPVSAPNQENDDMARGKRKAPDGVINGEVPKPDFDLAVSLYRNDIKPAQAKVGEYAQEQSTAYKAIKKQAHVEPNAARAAFRLDQMEEAKRDDWLRSFNGLLKTLNIFMPVDLADIAEGKGAAGENVVPMGQRAAPQLATIPMSDGKDDDLADDEPGAEAAE